MASEEKKNEEVPGIDPGAESPESAAAVPKAVFSDAFDDPDRHPEDELPEDEPLTPELVEEEAVRGDFMLRWAAVFLAVLMAFGQVNDTKPLVLIRSGDEMRAGGFLPSSTDRFSFTVEGQSITNVSWLFDHLISLSWKLAGEKGLTFLKVLIAGTAACLLVRISIPGVSTWWSSICAVFAIVACSSDFVPLPEVITVLGITVVMTLLAKHRLGIDSGLLWKLPLTIAIWCNFDSRAWVGAGVIAAYAMGSAISRMIAARRQSPGLTSGGSSPALPALLSVLALLVNPFHLNSLLTPLTTYSTEYPAMQAQRSLTAKDGQITEAARVRFDGRVDYFSALNPAAIRLFDHTQVAGLALLLVAFVVLLMSRSSRDAGFVTALMFVTLLAVLALHELPAASVVAATVAGISAQDWYRRSFSMNYTTDSRELLFSRGGRAATVMALAMMGFCVVASRLPGATPLGLGFDRDTKITIDTFSEQISQLDPDARILHTLIDHGDMLIWNGRRSFVDSRLLPFGRRSDLTSVFGKHGNVLDTLLARQNEPQGAPPSDPVEKERQEKERQQSMALAQETLAEYRISHVLTRLSPPGRADFNSVRNLSATGQWIPVSIGPSAAVMEKVPLSATEEELTAKAINLPKMAFQQNDLEPPKIRQAATPPGFYQKYVYRQRGFTSANKRMAMHFLELSVGDPGNLFQVQSTLATATMAVRHLNLSLSETPDDSESYRLLGQAYSAISAMERILAGQDLSERLGQLRYLQTVAAFRQCVTIDPDDKLAWFNLAQVYQQRNRTDLALEAMDTWLQLEEKSPSRKGEQYEQMLDQMYIRKRDLEDLLSQTESQVEEVVAKQQAAMRDQADAQAASGTGDALSAEDADAREAAELMIAVMTANNAGLPRQAFQKLRSQAELARQNPLGQVLQGQLMLEMGDIEESHQLLAILSQQAIRNPDVFGGLEWPLYTAISQMVVADYPSARDTFESQLRQLNTQTGSGQLYGGILYSLPLIADANYSVNQALPGWPLRHTQLITDAVRAANESRSDLALLIAVVKLEEGELTEARKYLDRILFEFGETRARGLATGYFMMMEPRTQELLNELQSGTWEDFEFPEESISSRTEN